MRDAQSMLDQLVAFCGNTIREADVLEIFGFTSVQTVSAMAQRILDSSTVGALQLVHQTSEAGKDLGKLLTDLIQHFRTLLVSQADPEAGAEDLEPDIAAQVSEQCQMASTEQLLRVVDGLAEVDARMRWATNKRLHFELGVIQAVQNYNEVSLSDVIEALDGGGTASLSRPVQRPQVTAARPAAPERAPVVERVVPKMEEPAPRPEIKAVPVPASAPEAPEPAPVAAEVSLPRSPEIEPIKIQERAPAPEPAKAAVSHEEFWPALIELVQERRALIASWVQLGTVQSIARGIVKVGFPTTESHAKDSLNRDNQRTFLEGIAEELLGVPMKFEFVLDASLRPPPVTELHFDLGDSTPAKPAPAPAAKPEPVPAPKPAAEEAGPVEAATAASISEDFQNDPLIKSAVEKFKLKLAARS
jgi:DNA polymerase-3 subunit gamma/tau